MAWTFLKGGTINANSPSGTGPQYVTHTAYLDGSHSVFAACFLNSVQAPNSAAGTTGLGAGQVMARRRVRL
jgi:hypothetical protein